MENADIDRVMGWRGRTVRDTNGEKVGKLGAIFLDSETDRPAWAGVNTGLFGTRESYVPLDRFEEDGDDLRVAVTKDHIGDAPRIDPDVALTSEEEAALYEHYGQQYEMTRSEEEVDVGKTEMAPTERLRLRKVRVTDEVTQTVPVRKEIVQLDSDPPPEGRIESVEDAGEAPPR